MASVKSILNCIGVDTSGSVSILFHLFGFTRARLPPDPEPTATAQVSLLQLVRDLQGRHLHLNVIRVGFDTLSAADQATGDERLDYAIYRTRNIYRAVSLGIGRVEHFVISAAQSNGRDIWAARTRQTSCLTSGDPITASTCLWCAIQRHGLRRYLACRRQLR